MLIIYWELNTSWWGNSLLNTSGAHEKEWEVGETKKGQGYILLYIKGHQFIGERAFEGFKWRVSVRNKHDTERAAFPTNRDSSEWRWALRRERVPPLLPQRNSFAFSQCSIDNRAHERSTPPFDLCHSFLSLHIWLALSINFEMFFYDTVILFFYLNHLLMENLAIYFRYTLNLICEYGNRFSLNYLTQSRHLFYGTGNARPKTAKSKT